MKQAAFFEPLERGIADRQITASCSGFQSGDGWWWIAGALSGCRIGNLRERLFCVLSHNAPEESALWKGFPGRDLKFRVLTFPASLCFDWNHENNKSRTSETRMPVSHSGAGQAVPEGWRCVIVREADAEAEEIPRHQKQLKQLRRASFKLLCGLTLPIRAA